MSEITRRNTLDGRATEPQQEGAMPGRELTGGVSQQDILEPQEQPGSSAGAYLETPLAGSQPHQQLEHSRLEAMPAVTRAGTAEKSFVRRSPDNHSDYAHLAAITTGPALAELRGLRLYTKEIPPDMAHETYGADSATGYTYAAMTNQSYSAGENAEIIPKTSEEAMTLPPKRSGKRPRTRKWRA